jgi:beta-carotene 3-hydroxylase
VAANALLFLVALAGMEVVAYLVHRHLMHGPLWCLHESHHVVHTSRFELNDLFGAFFALPSIVLIYLGTHGHPPLLWIGLGMTAYGMAYFGFHDVIVHRRLPVRVNPKKGYLRRIIQAHHRHHATRVRDGAVSFGFLYAPTLARLDAVQQRPRSS